MLPRRAVHAFLACAGAFVCFASPVGVPRAANSLVAEEGWEHSKLDRIRVMGRLPDLPHGGDSNALTQFIQQQDQQQQDQQDQQQQQQQEQQLLRPPQSPQGEGVRDIAPDSQPPPQGAGQEAPQSAQPAAASAEAPAPAGGGSSACMPVSPRGYLLYLAFGQQFNNQLLSLAENILLAKKLGRVLVLTGFMLQKADNSSSASNGLDYFSSEKVLHPVSSIFDVESSFAALGLDKGDYITLTEFKTLCSQPLKAEAHAFVSSYEGDVPGGETARWEGMPWKIPEKLYPWENSRSHPLPDVAEMSFVDAKLVARDSNHRTPLEQIPSGPSVPVVVTDGLLFKTEMTDPRYATFGDPFITVSKFRWANHIEARAQEYVNSHFGQNPFLAVHWRRGFAVTLISMEEVVGMLHNATVEIHQPGTPLPDVYVASNQLNAADKGQLESMLATGQRVHSLMLEPPQDVDLNTISHIEMAVCTRARAFMMTPGSTWSMNVRAFRGDFAASTTLTSIRQEAQMATKAATKASRLADFAAKGAASSA